MAVRENSTFINAYGEQLATNQQMAALASSTSLSNAQGVLSALYGVSPSDVQVAAADKTITVAITLNRANDPTSLLAGDWSARQAQLADQKAVFDKYGADAGTYLAVTQALSNIVGQAALTAATAAGYVSSAADRTIWMTLNPQQFAALFKTDLLHVRGTLAWGGNLDIPDAIAGSVRGLWLEHGTQISSPTLLATQSVPLKEGPQGVGNGTTVSVGALPTAVASEYAYPLKKETASPAVAVVENIVPSQDKLFAAINDYRAALGLAPYTAAQFQAVTGPVKPGTPGGELTLDISVIAGAGSGSPQLLYAYSNDGAPIKSDSTPFKAYQQIFFDAVNDPAVMTSSYAMLFKPTAGSPFQTAYQDLFVDGALSKVSVHIAAGDQGATGYWYNGVPNVVISDSPTYGLAVGGTSLATRESAKNDKTLSDIFDKAMLGDKATLLQLTASGLKTLPANLPERSPTEHARTLQAMIESVWNSYKVTPYKSNELQVSFGLNESGSGGVVTSLPTPTYQSDFGLAPNGITGMGRGSPDVSALSAGDSYYSVLNPDWVTGRSSFLMTGSGGTSASSPLWASLTAQLDAVFTDQGLPVLGFYNDLLYQAAAVAPGSFRDVTLGNNIDTFYLTSTNTGFYNPGSGSYMVPTGQGFTAAPGYDLASGLGSPNGLLLARAMTAIAQAQSHSLAPGVLGTIGAVSGLSLVTQTLLVQDELGGGTSSILQVARGPAVAANGGSALAWTSRLAEQSLQKDFDPALLTKLDGESHGTIYSVSLNPRQDVGVASNGTALGLYQASYTNPFGIVQFGNASGDVTLARPVSVAQTAGGADNQDAIVRVRQVTPDTLKLDLYRVDDFNGAINGLLPGQAGYAAAAAARDYRTDNGTTVITGPGYGNYGEAKLKGVNAGDIVAMHLTNVTTGGSFWGFAIANEKVDGAPVEHLWSYGLNTYGWEATTGGGDRDYNDLIVGIDYTSSSGHQLIA